MAWPRCFTHLVRTGGSAGRVYVRGRAWAHCDCTGANVLLSEDHSSVKLADFGCAQLLRGDTADSTATGPESTGACDRPTPTGRGTLAWKAPELIAGKDGTPAADIWSLGCTVAGMVTWSTQFGHLIWAFQSFLAPAGTLCCCCFFDWHYRILRPPPPIPPSPFVGTWGLLV